MRGARYFRSFLLLIISGMLILSCPVESYEYSWNFTILDSVGDAGKYCSLAYNPVTGYPAISYTESGSANLRFGWYNGSAWSVNRSLSDNALYTSFTFNSSGIPAIAFFSDTPSKEIRFIKALNEDWKDSELWDESLVKSLGIQISHPGLAFNLSDTPVIAHTGSMTELFFSYPDGDLWHSSEVLSRDCLSYTSVAINPLTGWPAIAYTLEFVGQKLQYSWYDGISWNSVFVHTSAGTGTGCSLAFNSSGYPGISYIQQPTGDLWYAWFNGSSWKQQLVDDVGSYSTVPDTKLVFNKSGCPGISYYDGCGGGSGNLKFAFCDLNHPYVWQIETVYSEGDSGIYNSFGFDQTYDLPSVAFYRKDTGDLYFGRKGAKPQADFTQSVSPGDVNMTVLFSDATYSQSSVIQWKWDFGDNTTYYGQNPPVHEYSFADTYQVSLNVSDIFGTSEITKNVAISTYSDFSMDKMSGTAPLRVNFSDLSRGGPLVWNWSFGDGQYYNTTDSLQKNTSHIFESAGNYTISLITGRNGLFNTTVRKNQISVGIGASFIADCLFGKTPLTVIFNDTSLGNPDTREWDFKDGTISNEVNTSHTFVSPGLYNVTLNASSGIISDTYSLMITVSGDTPSNNIAGGAGGSAGYYGGSANTKISTGYAYDEKAGDTVSFKMKKGAVNLLSAVFKDNIPEVMFSVESLAQREDLFEKPKSPVYEYCEVKIYRAPESSVMASSLSFDVRREWLENYGFSEDEVILLMYDKKNRKWAGLPVEFDGCSQAFCSYTARIPGFSYFAISGEKGAYQMPENSLKLNSKTETVADVFLESEVKNSKEVFGFSGILPNSLLSAYVMIPAVLLSSIIIFRIRWRNK